MNNSKPLLSVGLFVYNGERFLRGCLDSFVQQTFKDYELIISDNASTDRTGEICQEYAERDSRIRYYRSETNMGAGWNSRRVYELATGRYFKWAANDDRCEPDFLRRCLDVLENDPSVVLAHSLTRVVDENGNHLEFYDQSALRLESPDPLVRLGTLLLPHHRCYHIFGVIRLDVLHKLPPQGSFVHADRVLLAQLALMGRFHDIPEYLFISTKHIGQSVESRPERVKGKGFRLVNRPGAMPPLEWWDTRKARKIHFPEWHVLREYFQSIRHSPLPFFQKLKAYVLLGRWIAKYRRGFLKDLVIAADQVLFNLQQAILPRMHLKQVTGDSARK
jgi:glycosyltransferase involved in cell wall biosynthesis